MSCRHGPPSPDPPPSPPPPEKPAPLVINIGSRIATVLTDPGHRRRARPRDREVRERRVCRRSLAIPAGTLLVGEAFATQQDDRAQVVFSAIVRDGKTTKFAGGRLLNSKTQPSSNHAAAI
jgi:hypothetical protein